MTETEPGARRHDSRWECNVNAELYLVADTNCNGGRASKRDQSFGTRKRKNYTSGNSLNEEPQDLSSLAESTIDHHRCIIFGST